MSSSSSVKRQMSSMWRGVSSKKKKGGTSNYPHKIGTVWFLRGVFCPPVQTRYTHAVNKTDNEGTSQQYCSVHLLRNSVFYSLFWSWRFRHCFLSGGFRWSAGQLKQFRPTWRATPCHWSSRTDCDIDCNTWPGVWPAPEELIKPVKGGVSALKMYVLFTYPTCLLWRLQNA